MSSSAQIVAVGAVASIEAMRSRGSVPEGEAMRQIEKQDPAESGPPEKAFKVNCEVGPDVQEALAEMREAGYRFAQLMMPNTTYGWVIGVRYEVNRGG